MSRVKVSNVQDARVMMELQKELVLDDSTRSCAKKKPLLRMHDARPPMPRPVSPVAIVPFAPLSNSPLPSSPHPPALPTPVCLHLAAAMVDGGDRTRGQATDVMCRGAQAGYGAPC